MIVTFLLILLSWVFFRANSITDAFHFLGGIFDSSILSPVEMRFIKTLVLIVGFLGFEWLQRRKEHALEVENLMQPLRWGLYLIISVAIIENFVGQKSFIYFQF
jgi:alginate O-acetyltransferase complex protein AlgI